MSTPEEERLRAGIRRLIATGRGLSKGAEKTLRELIGEPKVSIRPQAGGPSVVCENCGKRMSLREAERENPIIDSEGFARYQCQECRE